MRCHLCASDALERVEGFERLRRVTSDCRPWPAGGRLLVCAHCGGVQKPVDAAGREELAEIYAAYEMYAQGGGSEQRAFDPQTGALDRRSPQIVAALTEAVALAPTGRWLDVGCGNGALLRAIAAALPQWRSVGTELDDRNRAVVEAIPGVERLHAGTLEELDGTFDAISLVHVLEHLESPVAFLEALRGRLNPGGFLIVESPLSRGNYFDLAIADHVTHFDETTLRATLQRAGLTVVATGRRFLDRELFAVAARSQAAVPAPATVSRAFVAVQVAWLARVAREVGALPPGAGIFGSSIGATFAAAARDGDVAFFLDEDPDRIGGRHLGRPVLAPEAAPAGAPVYVPLPPQLAAIVLAKPGREKWIAPPEYPVEPL